MENLKTMTGNDFSFRTEPEGTVSVLNSGYIITPEGKFVDIQDSEDHSTIFTNYLQKYLEDEKHGYVDTITGARELTELGHIVYLGVRQRDVQEIYATNREIDNKSMALLVFPSDPDKITPEQARSCLHLISTNKSFFGDYERININFHDFAVPEDIRDSIVNTLNKISDQSERKNNK